MALASALLVLLLTAPAAYAVQYTVGDSNGWTTGEDYTTWTSGKTFTVGDTLLFNYGGIHSVDEVSQSDYDSCNTGSPLKTHSGGNTVITLSDAGAKYFICPTGGHCSEGMKLAITVAAASGGTPSTPTTPSGSNSSPPPPPSGSGATTTVMNYNGLILGVSAVLGIVLAIMS